MSKILLHEKVKNVIVCVLLGVTVILMKFVGEDTPLYSHPLGWIAIVTGCLFYYVLIMVGTKEDSYKSQGSYLEGVTWCDYKRKFRVHCYNPLTKRNEDLGYYKEELPAHLQWCARKHEISVMVIQKETEKGSYLPTTVIALND